MKGKTTIILTNVETGEKVIHKDENLITMALDRFINIHTAMNIAPNNNCMLPIATQALGGLMLFDGFLDENEDNIHFPTDVHLVGYASQDANVTDKYRGSYNAMESGKTDDGYVSVWDFGTSQANGVIKSIARTNRWGGQCPLYWYHGDTGGSTNNGAPTTDLDWYPIRYDGEYVYALKADTSTHTMRLARVKIPMLRLGVADYSDVKRIYEVIATWSTEVTRYHWWYYEDHHGVTYEQVVYADDPRMYEDGNDGYIYCVFYGARRAYNDCPYDINYFTVNYGNGTFERSVTHQLRTGLGLCGSYTYEMFYADRYYGHVHDGVLYRIRNNRKIIDIIPLYDVTHIINVQVIQDDSNDYIEDICLVRPHNGGVWIEVYHYTDTGYNRLNGIVYPDGAFVLPDYSYQGTANDHGNANQYYYPRTADDCLTAWGRYSNDSFYRTWAANYLGTINNLSVPITKTAAQTMKIVYTLTDVDE